MRVTQVGKERVGTRMAWVLFEAKQRDLENVPS
jgi:hypothetical protein